MKCLIFAATKTGGQPSQVRQTMTVKEIKDGLDVYDDNTNVYLSFDGGYTYGGLTRPHLEEWPDEDD